MNWPLVAAAAIGGAIVGSFIATLCLRWPQGRQATAGRSCCDHCGRVLGPLELVPVISALLARGRCATCGGAIAGLHWRVEIAAALLAAGALMLQPNAQGAALAAFWLLLLAPAVLDARHQWLPDPLTLAVAVGGLAIGGLATGVSLADRLIGGAAGFLSLAIIAAAYSALRRRDGLGAGDPKLLGAIGLWTGWMALPAVLLIASSAGLALAIALRKGGGERMPFGTLLATGAVVWSVVNGAGQPILP